MKKFLLFTMAALLALSASAQVYDGITQPTDFRILVPSVISTDDGTTTVAPFVGYKYQPAEVFSATTILQYNVASNAFVPQVWLNLNLGGKFYLLTRSSYDIGKSRFRQGLATTLKLPLGFMVDATWDNVYDGNKFLDSDRLQVVGGYAYQRLVCNVGYSMRHSPGLIANARFKATDTTWLQLKYDGGLDAVSVTSIFNL